MRDLPEPVLNALSARVVHPIWLVHVTGRDRDTGEPASEGFWTGQGDIAVTVQSAETGSDVVRTYRGAGSTLNVEGIGGNGQIVSQSVTVSLSQIDENVANSIRGYDPTQAKIEIHSALFIPGTINLVEAPDRAFYGFINNIEIITPEAGGLGSITCQCESHSREFTRWSTETRSDQSQRRRSPTDGFYKYTSVAAEFNPHWGQFDTRVSSTPKNNFSQPVKVK